MTMKSTGFRVVMPRSSETIDVQEEDIAFIFVMDE
jgi:hypothetical protein